jgi:hypothetical protein
LATKLAKLAGEGEGYKNVWVWDIMIQSFHELNRIIDPRYRVNLEAFVRQLVEPAFDELGWEPQPGESPLIPRLRADLVRTLGTLGNHRRVQERAIELYERYKSNPAEVKDGDIVAALIRIVAHAGDATRYEEFCNNFKSPAATPQDKNRYLYALTAFQQPDLLQKTLDKTVIPEEIRTQDAPGVVQSILTSVYGRELAWAFVKGHWEPMSAHYHQSGLSRVCQGAIALSTPELASDVDQELRMVKIDGQTLQQYLGGKTLEQILERLRVFVGLREREGENLQDYLAECTPSVSEEVR